MQSHDKAFECASAEYLGYTAETLPLSPRNLRLHFIYLERPYHSEKLRNKELIEFYVASKNQLWMFLGHVYVIKLCAFFFFFSRPRWRRHQLHIHGTVQCTVHYPVMSLEMRPFANAGVWCGFYVRKVTSKYSQEKEKICCLFYALRNLFLG